MEGVAVNGTNSVLWGCGMLRDGDHKSPLAWSLSVEASSQGRNRGEKVGWREAGVQPSTIQPAESGTVHRESRR